MPIYPELSFTDQYISASYQRILQLSGSELIDGTGSVVWKLFTTESVITPNQTSSMSVLSSSYSITASYALNGGGTGTSGTSGTSGIDGTFFGSSGTSGFSGTSGSSGSSGTSGSSGSSGNSGSSGTSGQTGSSGETGSAGTAGSSGTSGVDGNFFGSSGTSGTSGVSTPSNPEMSIQFNKSGSFSGTDSLLWNYSINELLITGSLNTSGSIKSYNHVPCIDSFSNLGTSELRWNELHAVETFTGGIFENNLKTIGIEKYDSGTILVVKNGKLVPCEENESRFVIAVVKKDRDIPIVFGVESILVTGKIKPGDFIVTSKKSGHGKSLKFRWFKKIYKDLTGVIIAQSLEKSNSESNLIKALIIKM